MPLIQITPTALPGEAGLAAIAGLLQELARDATMEQKQAITQRFLELSAPYHAINVAIAEHVAQFLAKVLHIDLKEDQK